MRHLLGLQHFTLTQHFDFDITPLQRSRFAALGAFVLALPLVRHRIPAAAVSRAGVTCMRTVWQEVREARARLRGEVAAPVLEHGRTGRRRNPCKPEPALRKTS